MLHRPILVPLDGSELSEKAIPYAVSIAKATHQSLVLLSVWEGVESELGSAPVASGDAIDVHGRAQRKAYLDEVAQRIAAEGIEVAKETREGRPSEELLWYCQDHAPGMLVMATHGRSGIQRMWYGSVASKLMQMAAVPTLLVGPRVLENGKGPPAIRSILVPLGGSAFGESALEPAATLAEAFQARLVLARVARFESQTFAFDLPQAWIPDIDRAVTAAAEEYLLRLRDRVRTARPVETRVLRGSPAPAILAFVAQERIDLVVMASHGRRGVFRWALGSVADRTIQGAAPVLLIRPEAAPALTRSEEVRGRYCQTCGGAIAYVEIGQDDRCLRCGQHLHLCANCAYFNRLACLLQRSEVHDTYPGLTCPKFQFIETVQAKGRTKVGTKQ